MAGKSLVFTVIILTAIIFAPTTYAEEEIRLAPPSDTTMPKIEHAPIMEKVKSGKPLVISAKVTDNTKVEEVIVFYRAAEAENFTPLKMKIVAGDRYEAIIPEAVVREPRIEYFIQATDSAGNTIMRGIKISPLTVKVEPPIITKPEEIVSEVEPPDIQIPAPAEGDREEKKFGWGWAVLGAVAIGLVAAGLGGGDGGGGDGNTGSVTVRAPVPETP